MCKHILFFFNLLENSNELLIKISINNVILFNFYPKTSKFNQINLDRYLIHPWFITGFTDAEGSFLVSINKNKNTKLKYTLAPQFNITLHLRDASLIFEIQKFFSSRRKIGNIVISKKTNTIRFNVNSIKDLEVIINHFFNYPLISSKRDNFLIFLTNFNMIKNKNHLTESGFYTCLKYINILNKPIKDNLIDKLYSKNSFHILTFKNIITVPVSILYKNNFTLFNPFWLSGFIVGEGSFNILKRHRVTKNANNKIDFTFIFEISQKTKDEYILKYIQQFFTIGHIYSEKRGIFKFRIAAILELQHYLLPFLYHFPLYGYKYWQYEYWLKGVILKIYITQHNTRAEKNLKKFVDFDTKWSIISKDLSEFTHYHQYK